MKLKIKILLLCSLFLLICECSVNRLRITKIQTSFYPYEKTPKKIISLINIRHELNEGNFRVAEHMLKTVSQEEIENKIELCLSRGILYHRQNRLKMALREFEHCLSLLDSTVGQETKRDIYYNLASLNYDLNNFEKAALYYHNYREFGGKDYNESYIKFLERFSGVPYQIESKKQTTNLEMKYKKRVIKVKGNINNKEEVDFLVDTAANMNILSSKIAKKLGIQPLAGRPKARGPLIGELSASYGIINSIQLGDITIKNIPVIIIDSKKLTVKFLWVLPYFKIDALIGLPLLKQFDIVFDYKDKILSLDIPQERKEISSFEGNFYLFNNLIYLPIGINRIEDFYFILDTGGGVGYASIFPTGLNKLNGQQLNKDITLRIDNFILQNIFLNMQDIGLKADGIINNKLLENFRVKIDFIKMQIKFEIK